MPAALLWCMHSAPLAYERHPQAATRPGPNVYQRRKPEESVLYGIVSRKRKACIESAQERSSLNCLRIILIAAANS